MQLTKGMFGTELNPVEHFGLSCGLMYSSNTSIGHNAGWFNRDGERLGWGDISNWHVRRIQDQLEPTQFFIVLPEAKSFLDPLTHDAEGQNPSFSKEYLTEFYRLAITRDMVYQPITYPYTTAGIASNWIAHILQRPCMMIEPKEFLELLS